MKLTSLMLAGALLAGSFGSAALAADEEPSKAEQENMAKRAEALAQIATAAQLISLGRGELVETPQLKGIKNPGALVIAGGILLRVHNLTEGKIRPLEIEVKDDGGAVVKDAPKLKLLADEAEDLFKEAEAEVLTNKGDIKALNALIAKAKADAVVKGAIGGPQRANRVVSSGHNHTFSISFAAGAPAAVYVNSSSRVQVEVVNARGAVVYHGNPNSRHQFSWVPGKGAPGGITVKVINGGGPPAAYTLWTN